MNKNYDLFIKARIHPQIHLFPHSPSSWIKHHFLTKDVRTLATCMDFLHSYNLLIVSSPTELCRIHLKYYISKCEVDQNSCVGWFTSRDHSSLIPSFLLFTIFFSYFRFSFVLFLSSFIFVRTFPAWSILGQDTLKASHHFINNQWSFCSIPKSMGHSQPFPPLYNPEYFSRL